MIRVIICKIFCVYMCKNVYVFPNNSKAILLNYLFDSCVEFYSLMPKPHFAQFIPHGLNHTHGRKVEMGYTLVDCADAERKREIERVQFIYGILFLNVFGKKIL